MQGPRARLRLGVLALTFVLAACARTSRPAPQPWWGTDQVDRAERAPDPEFGGEIYVREVGVRDGPPLVLIHGLSEAGSGDFAAILPALRARFHVLLFDLPGFGRSSRAPDAYTPTRYARLVQKLVVRHFGERPVFVLGHSMGGAIAIELAGNHPASVARLALLDVAGILHYTDYVRTLVRAPRADDGFWTRTLKKTRSVLFEIGLFPLGHSRLEQLGLAERQRGDGVLSSGKTAALLFIQHDFGPALRRIEAPTLLGWGARDDVAPARTADALRYALKPARDHVFARSGHVPIATEPAEVTRVVTAFFVDALPVPSVPPPLASTRVGRCHRQRSRVFEGDYDRIEIHRCKRVLLHNVRTRVLRIERSDVELRGVEVLDSADGLHAVRSNIEWSGGRIEGSTCMDVSHTDLNLLAVRCAARERKLRVRVPGTLVGSASLLGDTHSYVRIHGRYDLERTEGEGGAAVEGLGAGVSAAAVRASTR